MNLITFTSDFGIKDEWVAVVKGVIKNIAPDAKIVDISHEIQSFNVFKGALVLQRAVKQIKAKVHLAVVDPGVGTRRRAVAIETKRGDILIGPDNGLLMPAVKELGFKKAVNITNKKLFLPTVSSTFHARDIFAPVSAHLLKNGDIKVAGREINKMMLEKLDIKPVKKQGNKIILSVIENDKFGTARLNLPAEKLKQYKLKQGKTYSVEINGSLFDLKFINVFGELDTLEAALIVDSSDQLSIAINRGKASDILNLKPGKTVKLILG